MGTTYGVIDNLTWVRGRHTFKTGMEIRRVRLNQGKTADNNLDFGNSDTGFENAGSLRYFFHRPVVLPQTSTHLLSAVFSG